MLAVVSVGATAASDCCWCDKATTTLATQTTGSNNKNYKLVFSDEFNEPGRDFENGKDDKWTGLTVGDTSNHGSAFYLPDQATVQTDPAYPEVSALRILTVKLPTPRLVRIQHVVHASCNERFAG